jgi:hypothetical protein
VLEVACQDHMCGVHVQTLSLRQLAGRKSGQSSRGGDKGRILGRLGVLQARSPLVQHGRTNG